MQKVAYFKDGNENVVYEIMDKQARDDIAALPKDIIDKLTSPFTSTGSIIQCHPVEGYPLDVSVSLEPIQSGSGDPSPDNIRPISGHTGAKLTRCGKNLADSAPNQSTTASGITFAVSNDGLGTKVTGTSTAAWAQNSPSMYPTITVQPGTYTFTRSRVNSISDGTVGFILRINGVNGDFVTSQAMTYTFSEQTKIGWFAVVMETGVTVDCTVWLQIELGSTPTAYEPYQGETFSASFGQTVYGGTLDWDKGVLTVDRAVLTLAGTEAWTNSTNVNKPNSYYINQRVAPSKFDDFYIGDFFTEYFHVCSHYKADLYNDVMPNNACHVYVSANGTTIQFRDDTCTSVDAFKAYLAAQYASGTPVQIAYKLATPNTIATTTHDIPALDGTNTVYADAGDVTVNGRIDPEYLNNNLLERIAALEAAALN